SVYAAALRTAVTAEFGLQWTDVEAGQAELVGFDRELLRHFSTRRREIEETVAELAKRDAQLVMRVAAAEEVYEAARVRVAAGTASARDIQMAEDLDWYAKLLS